MKERVAWGRKGLKQAMGAGQKKMSVPSLEILQLVYFVSMNVA
jgi:hypothetical protein